MKHTIEVEIPDGYEPVGFRPAVLSDQYLSYVMPGGLREVRTWVMASSSSTEVIIVKPVRWKPAHGDNYFYLSATLGVNFTTNHTSVTDNIMFSKGNFFKTEEDCQKAARKVSELLFELNDSS